MLGTRLCTSASSFFSQVIDSLPMYAFRRGVARYDGNRYKKTFPCLDQYLRMAFAQLTHRESLRDIEVCPRAQKDEFVPQGYPGQRFQKRHGRRERTPRLAYLGRSRSGIDSHPSLPVCRRGLTWGLILTTRFMRSMPLPRSVAIFRATRNGVRPISGANNGATAIAFGSPRSSRRALRAAPGLPQ